MTRLSGYRICACPLCGQERLFPAYGSINLTTAIPDDVFESMGRPVQCGCGNRFSVEEGRFVRWAKEVLFCRNNTESARFVHVVSRRTASVSERDAEGVFRVREDPVSAYGIRIAYAMGVANFMFSGKHLYAACEGVRNLGKQCSI